MVDWRKLLDSEPESKDLPRVLRLPGTYNVKPDYAPDFPAVAFVKRDMSCLYAIDELAAMVPPRPVVQTHKSSYVPSAETPRRRAYSQMVIRKTVDRLASAPEGTRHHSAMVAGFAMADLVAGGWIGSGDALSELEAGVRGFNKPGDAYAVAEWAFYRGGNTPAQFPDSFEEVEPHFNPQGFACCPEHPDLPLRPGKKGGYYCSKRMDAGYCDYRWAGDNYTPPTDMSLSAFRQSIISGFVSKSRVEV